MTGAPGVNDSGGVTGASGVTGAKVLTTLGTTRVKDPLVRLDGLKKAFPIRAGVLQRTVAEVRAVDGVDLEIARGETLGLVGSLIREAEAYARGNGATVLEAYPVDPESPSYRFMGQVRWFKQAGYREAGRAGTRRHIYRKLLVS